MKYQKVLSQFRYNDKRLQITYYVNIDGRGTTAPDSVLLLGGGQNGLVARLVAAAVPGVAVIPGLPHWEAAKDGSDIDRFSASYAEQMIQAVMKHYSLRIVSLLAESQAAPGILQFALAHPESVANVALIRPLGFNVNDLGKIPSERLRAFNARALMTFQQFLPFALRHPRHTAILASVGHARLLEYRPSAYASKFGAGLSFDATELCRKVALAVHRRGYELVILLAAKDKMFPPNEIVPNLTKAKLEHIEIMVNPDLYHASLGIPASQQELTTLLDRFRNLR